MKNKTYSSSDLYLCAYLKSQGFKLVDLIRDGRRTTFVFEDKPDRDQIIKSFYNDGTVEVNSFVHALQDLKAGVFNI